MTTAQLRNKMRRLREEREEAAEESGEINLVPYLDIVTNVVIFLLASVTYITALSNVNASAPTYGTGIGTSEATGPPPLNLTVNVSLNGFTIAASGGVLKNEATGTVPTVPKDPATADLPWQKLADFVRKIKDQYPDEHNIILTGNPEVPYEMMVKTMDTVRQDPEGKLMFPDVTLSAGIL
ncbi:MAG TPA: biopolymer transporter ExbD [Polyangia bacterium]|nr:biopolymer transporter ExbD [Polyangia bacterium]